MNLIFVAFVWRGFLVILFRTVTNHVTLFSWFEIGFPFGVW